MPYLTDSDLPSSSSATRRTAWTFTRPWPVPPWLA